MNKTRRKLWTSMALFVGLAAVSAVGIAAYRRPLGRLVRPKELRDMERACTAKKWPVALALATAYLKNHSEDPDASLTAARCCYAIGRWNDTDQYFRRAGDTVSDEDIWIWCEALNRMERWPEALSTITRLYERQPDSPRVLRQMIVIASQAGQDGAALRLADQLASHPEHAAVAYGLMGSIHQNQQRYALGIECFAKALELDPEGKTLPLAAVEVKIAMGWNCMQTGDAKQAETYLAQAVQEKPTDAMAPWLLGKARLALNDRAGAYEWWIESMRRNWHNPDALVSLGSLEMEEGRFEAAVDWLLLAAREVPTHSYPQEILGNAYVRLGLVEEGKAYLAEAEKLRKQELARREQERIIRTAPHSAAGLIAQAEQAMKAGESRRATALLEQAVQKYDDSRASEALEQIRGTPVAAPAISPTPQRLQANTENEKEQ